MNRQDAQGSWLGLMIGNSRLHWAWFIGETLYCAWDTDYLPISAVEQLTHGWNGVEWVDEFFPCDFSQNNYLLPLYLASVVPSQTVIWQAYPNVQTVTLEQLPLQGIYPTMGIDRALTLWGAGEVWGWPMLVIDAGTALTFTGGDVNRCLVGGAILPGLNLQFQSLAQRTTQLPLVDFTTVTSLPPRWALSTSEAIQSGVLRTLIAGIQDFVQAWQQQFPQSQIALTGGDRALLLNYLQSHPSLAAKLITDPYLVFWGIRYCRNVTK